MISPAPCDTNEKLGSSAIYAAVVRLTAQNSSQRHTADVCTRTNPQTTAVVTMIDARLGATSSALQWTRTDGQISTRVHRQPNSIRAVIVSNNPKPAVEAAFV